MYSVSGLFGINVPLSPEDYAPGFQCSLIALGSTAPLRRLEHAIY
jgi:hypothetical protein